VNSEYTFPSAAKSAVVDEDDSDDDAQGARSDLGGGIAWRALERRPAWCAVALVIIAPVWKIITPV